MREYLSAVLPGLANLQLQHLSDLTPSAWAGLHYGVTGTVGRGQTIVVVGRAFGGVVRVRGGDEAPIIVVVVVSWAVERFTLTNHDDAGRVSSTADTNRNSTTYGYDDAGRRTTVTDALNHVTAFSYDAAGNQATVLDANHNTTTYHYDELNRQVGVTYPDNSASSTA